MPKGGMYAPPGGQELGSYNGTGNYWWNRNLVLGGRSFAIYFSNYVRFVHANHLDTTTVVTDQTGAELQDQLFYPWGQQWTYTGTQEDLHFASLQQIDPDLGLYPTLFRMYSPTQGRWLTGDPDRCGVENPQGFDRYAYVTDNPTNKIAPLGLQVDSCDNAGYGIAHAGCGPDRGSLGALIAAVTVPDLGLAMGAGKYGSRGRRYNPGCVISCVLLYVDCLLVCISWGPYAPVCWALCVYYYYYVCLPSCGQGAGLAGGGALRSAIMFPAGNLADSGNACWPVNRRLWSCTTAGPPFRRD